MSTYREFRVSVRQEDGTCHEYPELAAHSADCIANAAVRFGPCKVRVVPA